MNPGPPDSTPTPLSYPRGKSGFVAWKSVKGKHWVQLRTRKENCFFSTPHFHATPLWGHQSPFPRGPGLIAGPHRHRWPWFFRITSGTEDSARAADILTSPGRSTRPRFSLLCRDPGPGSRVVLWESSSVLPKKRLPLCMNRYSSPVSPLKTFLRVHSPALNQDGAVRASTSLAFLLCP